MRAMDCAVVLLEHADNLGITVTNLQLQKYLHFINANFWRNFGRLLIDDSQFETWTYGPVNRSLYFHFNFYGSAPIDVDFERTRTAEFQGEINHNEEVEYLERNMDNFLHTLNEIDIFRLVDITHEEPIWRNHRNQILDGQHFTYSEDDMQNVDAIV